MSITSGAESIGDAGAVGWNFEMVVWGWGQGPGRSALNPTNRAFFWEAHEAWEAVWLAAGAETPVGRFLQGLIQAAAALLKRHVGMETGARNLLAKSRRNLGPAYEWLRAADRERFMGIR